MQSTQLTAGQKDLVDEAKLAMEFLTRELRVADEAVNSIQCATAPVLPVDCIPGTYDTIKFDKLPGYKEDTNLTGIVYAFDVLTNTLKRTSGAGTTILASNVTAFSVTLSATVSSFYTITVARQGSQGENFSLESAVRPRSLI